MLIHCNEAYQFQMASPSNNSGIRRRFSCRARKKKFRVTKNRSRNRLKFNSKLLSKALSMWEINTLRTLMVLFVLCRYCCSLWSSIYEVSNEALLGWEKRTFFGFCFTISHRSPGTVDRFEKNILIRCNPLTSIFQHKTNDGWIMFVAEVESQLRNGRNGKRYSRIEFASHSHLDILRGQAHDGLR